MTRPLGLSTVRRWDRTRQAIAMPKPIKTRTHAPFLRAFLWFLAVVVALSIGAGVSTWSLERAKQAALPGASPEIEAAYKRGLEAATKPAPCGMTEFLGGKK